MNDFLDPAAKHADRAFDVLPEEAFRHWLSRETTRATRYQDFFSVCLIKPDSGADNGASPDLQQAVSRKIAEILRSTDVVGRVQDGTAVLLLHTASAEAHRVAERLRARLENVAFPVGAAHGARRITLSVGEVSFPRDGYNDRVLLSRAQAHLDEAARRGGNQVVHTEDASD